MLALTCGEEVVSEAADRRQDEGAAEARAPAEDRQQLGGGQRARDLDQHHQDEVEVAVARHGHRVDGQAVVDEHDDDPGWGDGVSNRHRIDVASRNDIVSTSLVELKSFRPFFTGVEGHLSLAPALF